jgi:hypothetical protein
MRPTKPLIVLLIIFTLVLSGIAAKAEARPPQPPHHFWGEVAPGETSVEAGTNISVWIEITGNEMLVASVESSMDGGESIYSLFVFADNPENPERDGATDGDILYFKVGDELMNYEIDWESGESTNLDLTELYSTTPTTTTSTSTTPTNTTTTTSVAEFPVLLVVGVAVAASAAVVIVLIVYLKFMKK